MCPLNTWQNKTLAHTHSRFISRNSNNNSNGNENCNIFKYSTSIFCSPWSWHEFFSWLVWLCVCKYAGFACCCCIRLMQSGCCSLFAIKSLDSFTILIVSASLTHWALSQLHKMSTNVSIILLLFFGHACLLFFLLIKKTKFTEWISMICSNDCWFFFRHNSKLGQRKIYYTHNLRTHDKCATAIRSLLRLLLRLPFHSYSTDGTDIRLSFSFSITVAHCHVANSSPSTSIILAFVCCHAYWLRIFTSISITIWRWNRTHLCVKCTYIGTHLYNVLASSFRVCVCLCAVVFSVFELTCFSVNLKILNQ